MTILGTFSLAINQTTRAVTESFEVNGQTITLNLPKGKFVRIAGTGVELSVAGQTLKGDFGFERSGTTTVLSAANVSISLGGVVNVTEGTGQFTLAAGGMSGDLSVKVGLTIPGVTLEGTLKLSVDTRNGAKQLTVGGTGIKLAIAGQTLEGDFSFEKQAHDAHARVRQRQRSSSATRRPAASVCASPRRAPRASSSARRA